jgi:N-acetylglucosamine-6-phosphate deacetylase
MRVVSKGSGGGGGPSGVGMEQITKFCNCVILRNNALIKDDLWISGSTIINPEALFYTEKILPDKVVDCQGAIISPGFLDVQLNGMYKK